MTTSTNHPDVLLFRLYCIAIFCFCSFPMVFFSWLNQSNRQLIINPCNPCCPKMTLLCSFLLCNIPPYICTTFFIHSSGDGHLDCFHVLIIINYPAVNIGVYGFFQTMFFSGYMSRSGIAGLYSSSIFSF